MTECCGKISMSLLDPSQRNGSLSLAEQLRLVSETSGRPFRQPGFEVRVVRISQGN
jgi:hypothetical protein